MKNTDVGPTSALRNQALRAGHHQFHCSLGASSRWPDLGIKVKGHEESLFLHSQNVTEERFSSSVFLSHDQDKHVYILVMTVLPVCASAFSSSCRGFPQVYSAAVCRNSRVSVPGATGASQQAPSRFPRQHQLSELTTIPGFAFQGFASISQAPRGVVCPEKYRQPAHQTYGNLSMEAV